MKNELTHVSAPWRSTVPLEQAHVGIDIGRVIMAASDEGGRADTSFLSASDEGAMLTPPNDRAFAVIRRIVQASRGRVWLVSKAGPRIQALTRRWLTHWRFEAETGVPMANVFFCRERRDKATHAKHLKLTHFIDDRLDVLEHLRGVVPNLILFGYQGPRAVIPPCVHHLRTWAAVEVALLGDGQQPRA